MQTGSPRVFALRLLEVFVHTGCLSEDPALVLAREIQAEFPAVQVLVCPVSENYDRMHDLGIFAVPAFVLDGTVMATGVPKKESLAAKLRELDQ